jgi:iron(III) transport system ATP-binding protein
VTDSVLSLRSVTRSFDRRRVVDAVDLELHAGKVTALLGPSGCGKSTLLRMIAGLEPLDEGTIWSDGRLLSDTRSGVPPEARGLGLVFQDYALFPHLSVLDNVAFGLKGPRAEREREAARWLGTVRLADRAQAWPHNLSGGEQQRVALVRALARQPRAVLLDEPFSGLDRHLKSEVRATLVSALRAAGAAVLMVTHDAEEAMLMADDLALMDSGRVLQTGRPEELYRRPASLGAARLLGEVETFDVTVRNGTAITPFGRSPAEGHADGPAVGMVRPEDIRFASDGLPATVTEVAFGGAFTEVLLQSVQGRHRARLPAVGLRAGQPVHIAIEPGATRIFPLPETA